MVRVLVCTLYLRVMMLALSKWFYRFSSVTYCPYWIDSTEYTQHQQLSNRSHNCIRGILRFPIHRDWWFSCTLEITNIEQCFSTENVSTVRFVTPKIKLTWKMYGREQMCFCFIAVGHRSVMNHHYLWQGPIQTPAQFVILELAF